MKEGTFLERQLSTDGFADQRKWTSIRGNTGLNSFNPLTWKSHVIRGSFTSLSFSISGGVNLASRGQALLPSRVYTGDQGEGSGHARLGSTIDTGEGRIGNERTLVCDMLTWIVSPDMSSALVREVLSLVLLERTFTGISERCKKALKQTESVVGGSSKQEFASHFNIFWEQLLDVFKSVCRSRHRQQLS